MTEREEQIGRLFTAELQFRLASAVRLATTRKVQPLDVPMLWTHGGQSVRYEEIALRQDQADYAAFFLHRSATYLMAVAVKDAIRAAVSDPKTSSDAKVRDAYQIARLIRNAFAHAPFSPTWSIDPDCQNRTFAVPDVISLNTTGLQGTAFDWRHYGGPLALLSLCRFVRTEILGDDPALRKVVPMPQTVMYQIGDLTLIKVDAIPPNASKIEDRHLDGGIDLGGGYVARPEEK
ncbi:MAG: hypothetical protein ACYDA9_05990 [Terriglobia bacterium]